MMKVTIAHIVSPVAAVAGSELHRIQPITFSSIRWAAAEAADVADVSMFSAQLPADRSAVPEGFITTRDLERSLASMLPESNRQLPVIADILGRLYESTDAEYLVYSNADIAVMPVFYRMVAHYIAKGYDAFSITRRRISSRFRDVSELDEMYAEAGAEHPGHDMVVFHRSMFPKFVLGNAVVGLPFADMAILHNMIAFSTNFRLFTGKHLTFHIGMDAVKKWGEKYEYRYNRREALNAVRALYPHYHISAFPGANMPLIKRHFKWLMTPNFDYPTMLRLELSQFNRPRRPRVPQPSAEPVSGYMEWLIKQIRLDDEY